MLDNLLSLDNHIFLLINHDLTSPFLDAFFLLITNARFWIIPGVAAALVYLKIGKKRAAIVLLLSIITVGLTDPIAAQFIKPFVHRMRPCNPESLVEGGRFLLGFKTSNSFPSNHAMNMFGQAMLFTMFYPKSWGYFFTFAALIGYSRIYVGVHYPCDVLAGAIFGMMTAMCVFGAYRAIQKAWRKRQKINQPQAAPGHQPHLD